MLRWNKPAQAESATQYAALDAYVMKSYEQVQGWCHPDAIALARILNDVHIEKGVTGSIGEIGVYHGKYFIGLHNLKRAEERSLALDIFDWQDLNIDASGKGASQQIFEENVQKFAREPHLCMAHRCDSLTLSFAETQPWSTTHGRFRWFSVDGGHTAEHTINDFRLAAQWLAPGGIVVLDDYYNAHWHGVIEGVAHLFLNDRPRLAPFAYIANKHYFASLSDSGVYLKELRQRLEPHKDIAGSKLISMYGHPVLSLKCKAGFYERLAGSAAGST